MCKIRFKAKRWYSATNPGVSYVTIPKIQRHHCDMDAFRSDNRFLDSVNSDMFEPIVNKLVNNLYGHRICLSKEVSGVSFTEGAFLINVTIELT
jgi:hypothetical protein